MLKSVIPFHHFSVSLFTAHHLTTTHCPPLATRHSPLTAYNAILLLITHYYSLLQASNIHYAHKETQTWMQPELPHGFTGNTYEQSGWCYIESASSAMRSVMERSTASGLGGSMSAAHTAAAGLS